MVCLRAFIFRGECRNDQLREKVVAPGHEYGPLAVLDVVFAVPQIHGRTRKIVRIDSHCKIATIREDDERLRHVGKCRQDTRQFYVDHWNTPIAKTCTTVLLGGVGRLQYYVVQ